MSQKIVIVDYGMGNIHSVYKKLVKLGIEVSVSSKGDEILHADKLILPGVGHFGKAMQNLHELNLIEALNESVTFGKKPILGICLGMQLMTDSSEEGDKNGLGWFDGKVVRFNVSDPLTYKIPHMGWNSISIRKNSKLMSNISENSEFYFVHAYHVVMANKADILNETTYDYTFTSAIEKENIFGVQYHPEKSHDIGLQLFKNFVSL